MSSALEKRAVTTQTSGAITVHEKDVTVDSLREFVAMADVHGVDGDAKVHIKVEHVGDGNGGTAFETKMAVEAPVEFAYGSTSPHSKDPRTKRRNKIVKRAAIKGTVAVASVPVLLLVMGFFWHFLLFCLGLF